MKLRRTQTLDLLGRGPSPFNLCIGSQGRQKGEPNNQTIYYLRECNASPSTPKPDGLGIISILLGPIFVNVFTIENGPRNGENVLLVHGLGCSSYSFRHVVKYLGSSGIHVVAIDLLGSGFLDKSSLEENERWGGGIWDVFSEIKEKGLFWGFDQLVEQGRIPYEELETRVISSKSLKPLKLGSEEMGRVIGQVIDSINLSPVHLVLHDSALGIVCALGWCVRIIPPGWTGARQRARYLVKI
ncbi:hypothetical protein IFM89_001995 [Coptis chinensis]|uniref:AB hydrolase-1 domain-containing protein n=1 Tax=Coptis chinensis TaxID=261450 RepID=A0A835HG34_9MAGN|nr:hypothetical protein IFM89_001995 [Coptis chinensis]